LSCPKKYSKKKMHGNIIGVVETLNVDILSTYKEHIDHLVHF